MKIISAFRHHLFLLCVGFLATACDLQQIFDERIDDKQLLVLTPDFADTSVQLVFRDPETLAVLDEDFEVTVYSNKRLVDLNGNYKNEFIARGGVMEFSVSPEETVSESDPLQLSVSGNSGNNSKVLTRTELIFNTKGSHTSTLIPIDFNLDLTVENVDLAEKNNSIEKTKTLPKNTEALELNIQIDGKKPPLTAGGVKLGVFSNLIREFNSINAAIPTRGSFVGTYRGVQSLFTNNVDWLSKDQLTKDITIGVEGSGKGILDYNLFIVYANSLTKDITLLEYDQDGQYSRSTFSKDKGGSVFQGNFFEKVTGRDALFNTIKIEAQSYFGMIILDSRDNNQYKVCKEGFNLEFEGLSSTDNPNLIYVAKRNSDNKIFTIASFTVNSASNRYNSVQNGGANGRVFSVEGNTLEFAENSQYIIEPQVIELGGEELCGNTYTVRLKRRDTHKKHQLNLSMRNENQNVGLALTFSALLRKQGQDDTAWETVNFKQGSTSVYLEEGSTYEVKLTLADEPFEFTFTNDLSLVEAAVQATLRNVTRIKDINYTINQSADLNTIDAEIVFYEGQSLID